MTRSVQVSNFWTRCRPGKGVGASGRTSLDTGQSLVRVGIFETTPDFAEIHQIWSRLGPIYRDLARSRRDSAESQLDLVGSQRDVEEIRPNLDEISPNLNKISMDLEEIRPKLD